MWKHVRGGVLLAALGGAAAICVTANPLAAGIFSRGCRNCQRPVATCNCTVQQPVIQTQMVPQQVTTFRNEVVTEYRQEAVTQSVPVTTYRDVVVDEGGYQTVYVPKHVTKRVPQVSYQQQVAYRSVPYQVTRQVPQVVTQLVPQQTVRYQPYSYQMTQMAPAISVSQTSPLYAPSAYAPVPSMGCLPCGGVGYTTTPVVAAPPAIGQPVIGTQVSAPITTNPVTMLPPTSGSTLPSLATPEPPSTSTPVPDPKFLESPGAAKESWTTVGQRNGNPAAAVQSNDAQSANRSGLFKPARTVFRSWETQSRVAAGDSSPRQ